MSEWISVKDKLPNKNGKYLCCQSGRYINTHLFANNLNEVNKYDFPNKKRKGWYDYDGDWGYYEIKDVDYWMPLPKPPRTPKERGGDN